MIKNEIKLSTEFKAQTTKAIIAITLFSFVYFLIFLIAIALTILCVYGGIMLVVSFPRFITLALGLGLASLGFLILIFLVKFIFKSHKVDRSHLYEIKNEDEPELFALIDQIVKEVKTSFPKKVYLSAEVNAAVFYDSNFWSMILPIKKNLQIGLGLINTVTKSELKAILAHEFGHFSQRTMKVGSYVYNVNQVIFNMLYDNDSYERLIQKWADVSGYFSIFVFIAVQLIQAIQWILRKLYEVVNKSYMGLSREMEFHADEIAANVTGFEPLCSSLIRMSIADSSLNTVLNFYNDKVKENVKSINLYTEQQYVLNFIAEDSGIQINNNLPDVTLDELNKFNKSKLVIKDQWASHPSTEERIARLEQTNLRAIQLESDPANSIFKNIEALQKEFTTRTFKEVKYKGEVKLNSYEDFQQEFSTEFFNNSFSKFYNGYYNDKNPMLFDLVGEIAVPTRTSPKDLFSDKQVENVYLAIALQNDIETIRQIANNTIPIKTFDYDGKKYTRKESRMILPKLSTELEQLNKDLKENDICIYHYFKTCEQAHPGEAKLERLYEEFFAFDKEFESKSEIHSQLSMELQFLNYTTPYDQIKANFRKILPMEENFKEKIRELLADSRHHSALTKEIQESLDKYLSKQWVYFGSDAYFEGHLEVLLTALNHYAFLLSKGYFLVKRNLLDYQEALFKAPQPA